ncbi:hypothetical protein D3C83_201110 [compost metagenome]
MITGAAAGVLGAFWATGLLADMLFQVAPRDRAVFAGVPIVLGVAAGLAILVPARRASKLDPVKALRS